FHGARGRQEIPSIERWLLAAVGVFALGTTGFVTSMSGREPALSAAGLAPTENLARVAVLYMEPRGGDEAEFLASGLTEALIDELSAVSGLHVVSRNGSQLFRHAHATPDSIARTLEVGALVGGTVSVSGDRVRVDVALTGGAHGEQLASRRLERSRAEIFALQDELADTVAVFLRRAIGRELGARRLRSATAVVSAWELVQRAGQEQDAAAQLVAANDLDAAARRLTSADSLLALAEGEDASWLEPVLCRGWVAYGLSRLGGVDRAHNEEWIERGLAHAERALLMRPDDAGALELSATLRYWRYLLNLAGSPAESDELYHRAEHDFRASIAAAGGTRASAQNSLSHLLINKGELAEAKLNALQAYASDPFLENAHLTLWRIFSASWSLQDGVEAGRYCAEGLRRFPGDFRFAQCRLMLLALPGMQDGLSDAWRVLDEFTELSPPQVREVNRRRGMMYISIALAHSGLADSARSVVYAARAGADIDPLRDLAQLESITWSALGDTKEAVHQLELYLSANPQALHGLRTDAERRDLPWYHQALLDQPEFRALVGLH
ncbi:MAG: hypothetical protein ACYC28_15600, partial [Longimicrobiales bacterium]